MTIEEKFRIIEESLKQRNFKPATSPNWEWSLDANDQISEKYVIARCTQDNQQYCLVVDYDDKYYSIDAYKMAERITDRFQR